MMHTELYCPKLRELDRVAAIRAIHQAHIQLSAATREQPEESNLDNKPALAALASILRSVGHPGYFDGPVILAPAGSSTLVARAILDAFIVKTSESRGEDRPTEEEVAAVVSQASKLYD